MATLLRFLSVFCLLPILPSLCATAETTIRSDRSRPVSERVGNGIEGFDDSSRMAASRPTDGEFAIGKQSLGKRLLQDDADSSDSGEHYETAVAPRWTEDLVCEFAQTIRAS